MENDTLPEAQPVHAVGVTRLSPTKLKVLIGLGVALIAVVSIMLHQVPTTTHPVARVATRTALPSLPTAQDPPTALPTPTMTPLPFPFPGWKQAGPPAVNIGYAPSNPRDGYACGPVAAAGQVGPIMVYASSDGANFTHAATPLTGGFCELSINPTDPRDVLLTASSAEYVSGGSPVLTYARSVDGGQTWHTLPLSNQDGNWMLSSTAWLGNTLYGTLQKNDLTSATPTGGYSGVLATGLVASVAGGQFQAVAPVKLLPGLASTTTIPAVFSNGYTFYAYLIAQSCQTELRCPYAKTTAAGAAWSTISFTKGSLSVSDVRFAADQRTLIGITTSLPGSYVISTTSGATWQNLPQLGPDVFIISNIAILYSAPDGTIYLNSEFADVAGFYALAPEGSQWKQVIHGATPDILAVQSDAPGHGMVLWAAHDPNPNAGIFGYPGLQAYSLGN